MNISKINKYQKIPVNYCKKTTAGNTVEFLSMSSKPLAPPIQKIDYDHYCNTNTGEILEYLHTKSRAEGKNELRKSFKRIRDTINANCTESEKLHWITLTYAENMTDTERLYHDFKDFWLRFKRFCTKSNYPAPEYITVIEPQARGAWHCHCIFIWSIERPFIENSVFADIWGHGFVKIKAVKECDNLGAYLSAYLGDVPLEDGQAAPPNSTVKEVNGKRYIKGGRLNMYPTGANIIRTSRGIKRPSQEVIAPETAHIEKIKTGCRTFRSALKVESENSNLLLTKEYYNTKKPVTQAVALLQRAVACGIAVAEM